jgi:hypothetical protein
MFAVIYYLSTPVEDIFVIAPLLFTNVFVLSNKTTLL